MVKVIIYNNNGNILGLEVSGHAGYAKKGEDIVCAGVSVLMYTLLNSLEELLNISTDCVVSSGHIKYFLPNDIKKETFEKSQLIFKTIIVGLKNIRDSYNSYIYVLEKEV